MNPETRGGTENAYPKGITMETVDRSASPYFTSNPNVPDGRTHQELVRLTDKMIKGLE
jgi:hypothetical protein